jgi:hypothetical protein
MSPLMNVHNPRKRFLDHAQTWLLVAIVLLLVLLFLEGHGWAQAGLNNTGNETVNVNCLSGCSSSSSPSFGSAFPSTGTPIGVKNGANMVNLTADGSNNLDVNCIVGCSAGSTTPTDAFANPTTAGLNFSFSALYNGATWDRLRSAGIGNVTAATGILASSPYCEFLTALPVLTNATFGAAQCDSSARLLIGSIASTVTVSGTVTTTPPANASTNVAQLAGTTTSVNSGTKDAGTLRVVLATDQPQLTNKLLVTPDSVALPANQSTNVNQFGGTNVVTGTGTGGAGIPRVTVSSDSFPATQPVSGTVTSNQGSANAVPWNENIAQVQGAVPSQANPLAVQASSTLPGQAGVIPVVVLASTPPMSSTQNALLYRAQLKTYCYQNLSGCAPVTGGGGLK